MKVYKLTISSLLLILLINTNSFAKDTNKNDYQQIKNYVDNIFESEIKNNESIGISIGITKGKEKYYFNYGFTDKKIK